MRLNIKQCTYCPKKEDCEHKKKLQSEAKTILPNIVANHKCKVYDTLYKRGDEVVVTIMERDHRTWRFDKPLREDRGVVTSTSKGYFIIAFFNPVNIDSVEDGATGRTYNVLPVRGNQIRKVGEYKGAAFWEDLQHGDISQPQEPRSIYRNETF